MWLLFVAIGATDGEPLHRLFEAIREEPFECETNKTDQSVLQIFTLDLRTKTFGQSLLMALSERLVWS